MVISKDLQKISGIYQITVKTKSTTYTYIGSSINIYNRLYGHVRDLKQEKHGNIILQRLYDKYGLEKFSYDVLESGIDKELLAEREQFYINKTNPLINIKKDVVRNLPNPESIRQVSETNKRKWKTGTAVHSGTPMKPVNVYDLQGNFIEQFRSISEASRKYKGGMTHISGCCRKLRHSAGGFQFRFAGDSPERELPAHTKNRVNSKTYDIVLKINETQEIIDIKGGIHGLYKYFSHNLYDNPDVSYTLRLAPVKSSELLENPKATNTKTELETTNVTVEKLVDDYNGQSAPKPLKTN